MALAFFGKAASSFRPGFGARSISTTDTPVKVKTRLRVRPKITFAFSGSGIAISDRPEDLAKLGKESVTEIGLCIDITNEGATDVTIAEVGLAGWFESPRLAEYEPLLHDNQPWPRVLKPGDKVIAHLASGLKNQPVLKSFRRAYVRTDADQISYGSGGPALRHYIKWVRQIEGYA